jgi:hypothetical protein
MSVMISAWDLPIVLLVNGMLLATLIEASTECRVLQPLLPSACWTSCQTLGCHFQPDVLRGYYKEIP